MSTDTTPAGHVPAGHAPDNRVPVLLAGARTPVGKLGRALAGIGAVDLGALAVRAALERTPGIAPDQIVMGNVVQAGNGQNPARVAAVRGGVDRTVPGVTLNDVCLSGLSSAALAAQMIRGGEADAVLVGGFESMSRAPWAVGRPTTPRGSPTLVVGRPTARAAPDAEGRGPVDLLEHDGLWCALDGVGMGELSDTENARFGVSRADQDAFALASHQRAAEAARSGRLAEEITEVAGALTADEGVRPDTTCERLAALKPAFTPGGTITAGNASQMSDAGAAGLVCAAGVARAAGLEPLAEVTGRAVVAGPDSSLHRKPALAARKLLDRHGLTPQDVDVWEINEAFAGVVIASMRELGVDHECVNVNGGAIALGHPLGASGFRILLTLALELRRRDAEWGVATLCGGGGQGEAVLLRAAGG